MIEIIEIIEKEKSEEIRALDLLRESWLLIYKAKKILGENHGEYNALCRVNMEINSVMCKFPQIQKDSSDAANIEGIR